MLREMADCLVKKQFDIIEIDNDLDQRKVVASNLPCYIFNEFSSTRSMDGYTINTISNLYVENNDLTVNVNAGYHIILDNIEYEIVGVNQGSTYVNMNFTILKLGYVSETDSNVQ